MDPGAIDLAVKLGNFAIAIGAVIVALVRTRRSAVDDRLKEVQTRLGHGDERMDRHERRIGSVEQTIQSMPGRTDLHDVQIELVKLTGSLNEMRAVMEGNSNIMGRLEAIVSRHEEHLLDQGGGKR